MKKILSTLSGTFHYLQAERGCTAVFLASNGKQFAKNISTQIDKTNRQINNLKRSLKTWKNQHLIETKQLKQLESLLCQIPKLNKIRQQAHDLQLQANETIDFYSQELIWPLINIMLEIASSIKNHHPTAVNAYAYLLQWKERIGLERAVSTRGFVKHSFDNTAFLEHILFLLSEQHHYKKSFLSLATMEQQKLVTKISESPAFKTITVIHKKLKTSPQSAVLKNMRASDWFEILTNKIDALYDLEQDLIDTLDGSHQLAPSSTINIGKKNEYFDYIYNLSIFTGIDYKEINRIVQQGKVYKAPKNKFLFLENTMASHLHIILEGWVKVFKNSAEGKEMVLQILDRGNLILGSSVISQSCFHANSQTTSDAVLFSLPYTVLSKYIKSNNTLAINLLHNIAKHSQILDGEIENIKLKPAPERIMYFLLELLIKQNWRSNTVQLPYSKFLLASYLNMKQETLSRAISSLKKQGFITNKNTIAIPEKHTLCKYCDIRTLSICSLHQSGQCENKSVYCSTNFS